jgi:16S rRNA (adenine1518-N6/adenine1519-N6)-dimethyltransferase
MTLLGAAEIRELAQELGIKPAKSLGQNFVIDANVCRKIVRTAGVTSSDVALEIGPGLGSLTLALLEEAKSVIAVEIDERLALRVPQTVEAHNEGSSTFSVIHQDALHLKALPDEPTVLVANLPYNVSVPVLLHLLEIFTTLQSAVLLLQA